MILVNKIMGSRHREIELMSKEMTKKCDDAIFALGLDKHRDRYFARTRQGDITGSIKKYTYTRLNIPDISDSFESRKLNQGSIVLPDADIKKAIQIVL
jgi:hypothetical protein